MSSTAFAGEELAASADLFLTEQWTSPRRRQGLAAGMDAALYQELADQGLFTTMLSPQASGLGLGLTEVAALARVFGRHLLGGPWVESLVVAPRIANRMPAAADLLSSVFGGREVLALVDEAMFSGSTPAGAGEMRTRGGALFGDLRLVRFGHGASWLLYVVDTPDPLLLLVAADHDAITVHPEESNDPASRFARVVVDGLPLDANTTMVGSEAEETIQALRRDLRVVAAHEMAGIATQLLAMSVDHAGQRAQFGRPIGNFQAVQHILAEMVELAGSLENLCEAVIADSANPPDQGLTGSLIVKAHAARVGPQVALMALQVHGGIGFTEEHDLHLFLKRALSLEHYYGGERDLHRAIGRQALVRP